MRLTQAESERNRKQILEAAGRLFRERGFDGVGVDGLMKGAGFTHGGFYNHFASKEELEAEASAAGIVQKNAELVEMLSDPRMDAWKRYVRYYLSARHRGDRARWCWPALWPPPIPSSPRRFSTPTAAGSAERPAQAVRERAEVDTRAIGRPRAPCRSRAPARSRARAGGRRPCRS